MAERPSLSRNGSKMLRRPTIRDVAQAAAVSPGTVSNVLTGRRNVDPAIRERVLGAVEALGYRPDVAASSLRSTERNVVGAVVPELTNPFFACLVDRLEREARAAGKRLLVGASNGDPLEEEREVAALAAWRPAGLIVVPCDGRFGARRLLEREGVPFVVVDRPLEEGEPVDTIAVDNAAAAAEAAHRLLALGHRRVLAIASSLALGNMRERLAGVEAEVAAVDGAELETLEAGFEPEEITTAVAARLAREPRPTAVFALNNVLTLGVLRASADIGLVVPDDFSLIGFDDYDWMEVFRPPLTAVRQPVPELAHMAWQRLAERIGPAAEDTVAGTPCHLRLPCHLIWRGSVAVPPEVRIGSSSSKSAAATTGSCSS
ncbi:LacI family DNA-binding transcriptional regulator [Benzoatithermus flavus]|uniref:LacI family DNA-binding transcriptional regulator n=1 Tax=Benzoatithermus flavus TaxID=3108223 RepID=A0ABU8XQR4_9PROT